MTKTKKMDIQGNEVSIISHNDQDYICLTDMLKAKDGEFFVSDWLRNRNTLEFLGVWEEMNNPDFNYGGFALIRNQAGLNNYKISVKEWGEQTNAVGLVARTGRYGGTYAHRDIAFEFGTWISPVFKLYLIREYQRLKEIETNQYNLEWNVKRILSKANYHVHTDAVKNYIVPKSNLPKSKEGIAYADEADILNLALFGCTAKEWREANPQLAAENQNIRDIASINELVVLTNLENLNAEMIRTGLAKQERFQQLAVIAKRQLEIFDKLDVMKSLKKKSDDVYLINQKKPGEDQ